MINQALLLSILSFLLQLELLWSEVAIAKRDGDEMDDVCMDGTMDIINGEGNGRKKVC